MGSITDALKAKGATGSNIAECIETLPSSEGGSADPGYTVETQTIVYFDGEVTTAKSDADSPEALLNLEEDIDDDSITVTFNSVDYVCEKHSYPYGFIVYGEFDPTQEGPIFTTYPFMIYHNPSTGWGILTEAEGTYSVKIASEQETVTTTSDFEKAVASTRSWENGIFAINIVNDPNGGVMLDKTFAEIHQAGIDRKVRIINRLLEGSGSVYVGTDNWQGVLLLSQWYTGTDMGIVYVACLEIEDGPATIQLRTYSAASPDDHPRAS